MIPRFPRQRTPLTNGSSCFPARACARNYPAARLPCFTPIRSSGGRASVQQHGTHKTALLLPLCFKFFVVDDRPEPGPLLIFQESPPYCADNSLPLAAAAFNPCGRRLPGLRPGTLFPVSAGKPAPRPQPTLVGDIEGKVIRQHPAHRQK